MRQVITPAPREEWRAALAGDARALPEHAPEWIDALCADGRYTDASRYYVTDDGRTFVLPLVARRGPLGLGGWLQCFPPSWGIGGLVGANADADVLRAVVADPPPDPQASESDCVPTPPAGPTGRGPSPTTARC